MMICQGRYTQEAQIAITAFIKGDLSRSKLTHVINALDHEAICETRLSGHTYLVDVLPHSFEITNQYTLNKRHTTIIELFLKRARTLSSQTLSFLLFHSNHEGLTLLHKLAQFGHSNSMKIYFSMIHWVIAEQWIQDDEYISLLLKPCKDGFTPLHQVLSSGSVDSLKMYLGEVHWAMNQKKMQQYEYINLLVKPNKNGFTPLQIVLQKANPSNTHCYLQEVYNAFRQKKLPDDEYINLLLEPNCNGYTPLHEALLAGNLKNLQLYLAAVHQALNEGYMLNEEYMYLLLKASKQEFTPLYSLLLSTTNTDSLQIYLAELHTLAWITDPTLNKEYVNLLTQSHREGCNLICEIIHSECVENLRGYLSEVHWAMSEKIISNEYYTELILFNKKGLSPLYAALSSPNPIVLQTYLNEVYWAFSQGIISNEHYLDFLTKPSNKTELSPLHHVLKVAHSQNLEIYLSRICQPPRRDK